MKQFILAGKITFIFVVFSFMTAQTSFAQASSKEKLSKIDQSIQAGFAALKAQKWIVAEREFEDGLSIFEKEGQSSQLLFTLFSIPDQENSYPPKNPQEERLNEYRHRLATKQALLQFLSFTYQLDGKTAMATTYHDLVYNMQGPLWGLSWRIFVPCFYQVFNSFVKNQKGENFGRYLYLAGVLIADAGDGTAFDILQTAQQNAPKDADIAGLLANGFLQRKNPAEARKQAELSLSIKPDQVSVLIDLATAELFLNDFDDSIKHAGVAVKLDAEAPGPRATLALDYIGKKDFPRALEESAIGTNLSQRHPFYLTVQSAALESAGNGTEAEKLLLEAWDQKLPTSEDLNKWYISGNLREIILKIVERLNETKIKA